MTTLENKKKWIPTVVKEGWLALFAHDAKNPAAYLRDRDGALEAGTHKGGLIMTTGKKKRAVRRTKNENVKIGIIGGSGLYHMAGLTDTREVRIKTPFGEPSDALVIVRWKASGWRFWRGTGADIYILQVISITGRISAR